VRCRDVKPLLHLFAEGELSPGLRRGVEEHLAACARCASELEEVRRYAAELRSLKRVAAPTDLLERVRRKLERPSPVHRLGELLFFPPGRKLPLGAAALLAAAVLVVVIRAPLEKHEGGPPIAEKSAREESFTVARQERDARRDIPVSAGERAGGKISGTANGPAGKEEVYYITLAAYREAPASADEENRLSGREMQLAKKDAPAPAEKAARLKSVEPGLPEATVKSEDEAGREGLTEKITGIVGSIGGTVVESKLPDDDAPAGHLTVRIPAGRYGEFVDRLGGVGAVRDATKETDKTKRASGSLTVRIRLLHGPAPHAEK
jgi:anti-sigma factor RsiW